MELGKYTGALVLSMIAGYAHAQSPPEPSKSAVIEEVIVTANRREERLQDVPISVTALSAEELAANGITEPRMLTQVVPGLTFGKFGINSQPVVRGVGTNSINPGDEANVAIYIDGVYQPELTNNNFDLLQVEQIEVLRGPQGTLFGRNATGGLINIITPDPKFDAEGVVDARVGRFNYGQLRAYVTGGLSRTVAADLSLLYSKDDGYKKDLLRGGHTGSRESKAIRAKLLFAPQDDIKLVAAAYYNQQSDNTAQAGQIFENNYLNRNLVPAVLIPSKPNEIALDAKPYAKSDQWGASLQSRFEINNLTLETTTAYQNNLVDQQIDTDFTSQFLQYLKFKLKSENLSQEIRLLSPAGQKLTWVAGLFGFQNRSNTQVYLFIPGLTRRIIPYSRTRAYAAFVQGSFNITDKLEATGGLRYSHEKSKL